MRCERKSHSCCWPSHLVPLISINAAVYKSEQHSPSFLTGLLFLSPQNVPEGRRETSDDDGEEEKEEEDDRCSDEGFMGMTPLLQAHHAMEKVEEFVHKVMSSHSFVPPAASIKPGQYDQ